MYTNRSHVYIRGTCIVMYILLTFLLTYIVTNIFIYIYPVHTEDICVLFLLYTHVSWCIYSTLYTARPTYIERMCSLSCIWIRRGIYIHIYIYMSPDVYTTRTTYIDRIHMCPDVYTALYIQLDQHTLRECVL